MKSIALDITFENCRLSLISVYGPNEDNPAFYEKIAETIKSFDNKNVIVIGDYDLVFSPGLDYLNYLHTNIIDHKA